MPDSSANPGRLPPPHHIPVPSTLRYGDFRFLWLANLFNSIGAMGENVILGWIILEISGSPLMVGVALGLRRAPSFFLGILGGAIVDRVDRRRLMPMLDVGSAAVATSMGLLLLLKQEEILYLLLLSFVGGSLRAIYDTARLSFTFDIVGASNILSGLAFLTLSTRIGTIIGSLGVGFLIVTLDSDVAYIMLATSYMLSAMTLLFIRSRGQAAPTVQQPVWQSLKEYGREIRSNNPLLALVFLATAAEALGFSHFILLPIIARDVLQVGADGLGIMVAVGSVGGIASVLVVSALGGMQHRGLTLLVALHLFGGFVVLLGFASTFLLALAAIMLINAMAALSDIFSQSLMQTVVPNELRGRAMGSWVLAVGMGPLGQLQIGALASVVGVASTLAIYGWGLIGIAAASFALFPKLRKL